MKRFFLTFLMFFTAAFFLNVQPAGAFPQEQQQQQQALTGKVVETMDSAGYTYVCLENKGKKTWLAVPQMKVTKGKTMSFQPGMEMVNFKSKTLDRTFDKIIFSGGPVQQK